MILTHKQELALKLAIDRYKHHKKYTVISGMAGVGKSFLIRYIIEALGIDEQYVVYATYTGKAAEVLAKRGNRNVSTLHKLLYESYPKPDGTFYRRPIRKLDYRLVIVDECSMIPKYLVDLLLSHSVHVIFCGDPFQIPPLLPEYDNHLLEKPDIFLDEIMRQEEGSDIIELSMKIRNHELLPYNFKGKDAIIARKKDLSTGMLNWADQVIVATNRTRNSLNAQMRALKGIKSNIPIEGDKVICTRNYWDVFSDADSPLINGTIGYLKNNFDIQHFIPKHLGGKAIDVTISNIISETGEVYSNIPIDTQMITTGKKCVDKELEYRLMKNPKTKNIVPYEFSYGYAITGHKAQGSSWSNVLVIEEGFPFDEEEHARWVYTCLTRAENKVVLLR